MSYEAQREAQRRRWSKPDAKATHCPQGHEFTPENTRVGTSPARSNGKAGRVCRQCERAYNRRRYFELKAVGIRKGGPGGKKKR